MCLSDLHCNYASCILASLKPSTSFSLLSGDLRVAVVSSCGLEQPPPRCFHKF